MDPEEDTYTVIFSSLKHPIRRKILRILNESPSTYTELLKSLGLETGVLNYHLDSLRDLLMKSDDKYGLSEYGKAAINLITNVEEPVEKRREEIRLFGHRIKPTTIIIVSLILLLSSNMIWFYSFAQVSEVNRITLIWAISDSRDSIHSSIVELNTSITKGYIDSRTLFAVSDYSNRLGIQLETLSRINQVNAEEWLNIRRSIGALGEFCEVFGEGIYLNFVAHGANPYKNLTWVYKPMFEKIVHDLGIIECGISGTGPCPEAVKAADQLVEDLEHARLAFNVPTKFYP
ncbi:winged helix-turn-helix transcriptional regulator [Candidatus Bathyarchaeota archaeon]|nr:winged helix-turn-helix transcriptional regulator [Candidatus Bathyarchaeota archaeon]MBS7630269.1 winged helix-turn-helix transcriptional regulator [Candidatus Bathyarchaeota archaeon]